MSYPVVGTRGQLLNGRPGILYSFAAAQAVSTETPLLALTEIGVLWSTVWATIRNHHATIPALAVLDRSESGSVNDEMRKLATVPALGEYTFVLDDTPGRELTRMMALSAAGDPDAGYPSITVSWQVRVALRLSP